GAQHAPGDRHGPPQQRSRRRQARLHRLGRVQSSQVARPSSAGAFEDERPREDPEDLQRVLTMSMELAAAPVVNAPHGPFGELLAGLADQPFILLFLVVAAGYAVGRLSWKGVGLGATASTLIIALAMSLWATSHGVTFQIPEFASTIFFNLFMFSVGMKV